MFEALRLDGKVIGEVWLHEPRGRLHHWHHHDEPEFNLVLRGHATYLLADRRYELHRHGLVWLFPRQEHMMVDLSEDLTMWIGVIRPTALRQVVADHAPYQGLLDADPPGAFCRLLAPGDAAFLDRVCRDITRGGDHVRQNAGMPYLFLTAWDRFQQSGAIDSTRLHPALLRATAALARNTAIAATALAKVSGVSRFHLARLFRSELGTTMLAWRSRARIEQAMGLRRARPDLEWTDIAETCGFGSYAQFQRTFSQVVGMTPRRWRSAKD